MTLYISIDDLVSLRNRLTNRRDEQIDYIAVDQIDTQLAKVPASEDNRVDLLLGRQCAVLPVRPDYGLKPGWSVNPVVTLEQPETIALMEQTRILYDAAQDWQYIKGDLAL